MQPMYTVRADSPAVASAVKLIQALAGVPLKVTLIDETDSWGAETHEVLFESASGKKFQATAGILAAFPLVPLNEMKSLGMV